MQCPGVLIVAASPRPNGQPANPFLVVFVNYGVAKIFSRRRKTLGDSHRDRLRPIALAIPGSFGGKLGSRAEAVVLAMQSSQCLRIGQKWRSHQRHFSSVLRTIAPLRGFGVLNRSGSVGFGRCCDQSYPFGAVSGSPGTMTTIPALERYGCGPSSVMRCSIVVSSMTCMSSSRLGVALPCGVAGKVGAPNVAIPPGDSATKAPLAFGLGHLGPASAQHWQLREFAVEIMTVITGRHGGIKGWVRELGCPLSPGFL